MLVIMFWHVVLAEAFKLVLLLPQCLLLLKEVLFEEFLLDLFDQLLAYGVRPEYSRELLDGQLGIFALTSAKLARVQCLKTLPNESGIGRKPKSNQRLRELFKANATGAVIVHDVEEFL